MDTETGEKLELKIAYLENANQELSDMVYRQQQDIDRLKAELQALTGRVDSIKVEPEYTLEEEKPPHY
jgi:SlyX protein